MCYKRSIRIDDAPPPPLQIEAIPFSPGFNAWAKWTTILAPDILKIKITQFKDW